MGRHFRTPRIVPWTSNQEFLQVFEWLYSDVSQRPDLVQLGVDRLKAWQCRGKIPVAITATMDLIELQLREQKEKQYPTLSQNELRLLYSSVLTRFVNILEDSQQKGYFARSLFNIANQIGLPLHFVELRHAATHEGLPGLLTLRQASVQALQWLYDTYWSAQIQPDTLDAVDDRLMRVLSQLLTTYKETRKAFLKNPKPKAKDRLEVERTISNLTYRLSQDIINDSIVPLLLKIGGLVPAGKKKRASVDKMSISEDLIQLWMPLLLELDKEYPNFITNLVNAMLDRLDIDNGFKLSENVSQSFSFMSNVVQQDQESEKFKQTSYLLTLTCWLRYFVSCVYRKTGNNRFDQSVLNDILEGCLKKPNTYSRSVLQSIMVADPILGKKLTPFIIYIDRSMTLTSNDTNKSSDSMDIPMEEELDALTQQMTQLKKKLGIDDTSLTFDDTRIHSESGWTLHDEKSWKPCPIGCLPDGRIPNLDLMIADDDMMID
ncbi:Las1-like-domain-containing protein [Halteromyces radiatus]|uniref:Las1-like-domain-containing protein n=1 Tax=Halteromyces radiatus TaxID=101107 RepID=UPI0022208CBA|nr:Las1-like-domain-containing protein [Halteromyces radiatus]KAI8088910.1 Las1-like-domain-containing protein [Halteromyces radiatus]